MASIIDNKLQIWKKKLLDLSNRNRLLNYKETKQSTLQIVYMGIICGGLMRNLIRFIANLKDSGEISRVQLDDSFVNKGAITEVLL